MVANRSRLGPPRVGYRAHWRRPLSAPTAWRVLLLGRRIRLKAALSLMAYVELHARSAFSFLRGASLPEDLIRAALEAKLPAIALLDRDGVYGAPRLYASAQENDLSVRPRVGAEITLEDGSVLPLLAAT